jgi:hypothetical protein
MVSEAGVWAFNSPIFPDVLVSSRILSEGVDLHRFCRHVIHHFGLEPKRVGATQRPC